MSNIFDFIIIGSGCAGSVIAGRLAEIKDYRILILEAGQDNSQESTNPNMTEWDKALTKIPAFSTAINSRYNHMPDGSLAVCKSLDSYTTTPQGNANGDSADIPNKIYSYPRGNGAGGSTNHNALVYGRGDPLVYDRIAEYVQDPVWSYNNILPYYKKMETYNVPDETPGIHGHDGWLQIRQTGDITVDLRQEFIDAITSTPENIPLRTDPNDPSQIAGVYICQEQVTNDAIRCNAYESLLKPKLQTQSNIEIKFNCTVEKVITQDSRAVGVLVYEKAFLQNANTSGNMVVNNTTVIVPNKNFPPVSRYFATKEVIICAGALITPQILMLSGIGPRQHLTDVGIEVVKDLSGVGQNLMDHMESNLIYSLDPSKILWSWQATYFKLFSPGWETSPYASQIQTFGKDSFSEVPTNAVSLICDWYADGVVGPQPYAPTVHTHLINGCYYDFCKEFHLPNGDDYQAFQHSKDTAMPNPDGNGAFSNSIQTGKEEMINQMFDVNNPLVLMNYLTENYPIDINTLGSIRLNSKDCREQPIIDLNLWADDAALERLALTIQKFREIMRKPEMLFYSKSGVYDNDYELWPGIEYKTIPKLKEFVRCHQAYGHHVAGTARMGSKNDDGAVLDSRCRVRGIKGLRVVDASIYTAPNLHEYNPSCGIYMMAEVAADFIKAEYPVPVPVPVPPTPIAGRGKYQDNPNAGNARISKAICGSVINCQKYQNYMLWRK